MLFYNKKIGIRILLILIVCTSCKKQTDTTAKYSHYRYEVNPSDTSEYYHVTWRASFGGKGPWTTVDKSNQKGNFLYVDSIPKNNYPDTIFLETSIRGDLSSNPMSVSLKIYFDDQLVNELEGTISLTPYVSQRIKYKLL